VAEPCTYRNTERTSELKHKALAVLACLLLSPIILATSIEAAGSSPTLTSVSIDSNNATSDGTSETTKAGDAVTISFTADTAIQVPTVGFTVGGVQATGSVSVKDGAPGTSWVKMAGGYAHTAALRSDGTLWAWGSSNYGQIGDGTTEDKIMPTQIGTDTNWSTVDLGYYHTLAIKSDGTLWAWGGNMKGQIGDGTTVNRNTPTQIVSDTDWSAISSVA
jgi:hypothetical protein